jgi:hypothetical protein
VRGSKQSHSKHPWINFPVKEIYEYIYILYYIYNIIIYNIYVPTASQPILLSMQVTSQPRLQLRSFWGFPAMMNRFY